MQDPRQIVDAFDQVVVLGARPGDAGGVGLLECVVADQMRRHLAGEADHGDAVHQRVRQAGDRIGRARPRSHQDDADLAGGARVSFGGMHRAAFLADQDVTEGFLLVQGVVDRQNGAAGIAENDVDAPIHQHLEYDLGSGQLSVIHLVHLHANKSWSEPRPRKDPPDEILPGHGWTGRHRRMRPRGGKRQ